jgi:hypothetical protein
MKRCRVQRRFCLRRCACVGIALSLANVLHMGRGMKLLVKESVRWGESGVRSNFSVQC